MLMQTDVNAVPVSTPAGRSFLSRTRKLGTTSLNQGFGELSSFIHWPVTVFMSLSRA